MDLYTIRKKLNMGISLSSINLRVTYYSRVSTEHMEQKSSLKNQIEYFEEMIKNNNNWIYVKGYVDDGISGTSAVKRDNFMKMIEDAKNDKFDLIITKEISRFSRNTLDSIKYTRDLLSYGVSVLFVNDNINTILPDSELRLTIMASMAQDEIRRLSERVKFGMNRAIVNGKILGNDMLYGYKKDKNTGKLMIVENEAYIIKRLYDLYVINNYSINKICNIFNKEGIRTRNNNKWCVSTLSRMIKNPKYKGYYCSRKTQIADYMTKKIKKNSSDEWILYEDSEKIPPIISLGLWEKANSKISKRKETMYQNRYPLSAKIYCEKHKSLFHRRIQCKSGNEVSWVCSKLLREGKNKCECINIRESELYSIIDDLINFNKEKLISILIDTYYSISDNEKDKRINQFEKQRDKIILKKEKILELNIEGIITNKEFYEKNIEYNKEIQSIDNYINNMKKNNIIDKNTISSIIDYEIIRAKLIDLLVDKIIVSNRNSKDDIELKIIWKNSIFKNKEYEFKRGFNTISTRRYIVNYYVKSFLDNDYISTIIK